MHASISAGPFPCGSTLLSHAVDFRRLDEASRHREIGRVAGLVMERIARIIPVLPVSLLAAVFLRGDGEGLSELELKSGAYGLIQELEGRGAHIYVPRGDLDYAIGVGLRMLLLRRAVGERLYRAAPGERPLLSYYANAIAPLLDGPAVSAASGKTD
jgi:glycerol-3-phosphate O-acyltransferase